MCVCGGGLSSSFWGVGGGEGLFSSRAAAMTVKFVPSEPNCPADTACMLQ